MTQIFVSQATGAVPVTIFRLEGDLSAGEMLRQQVEDAYKEGARYVVLDLSGVPYISSNGLRAIHHIFDLLRAHADSSLVRKGIVEGTYKSPHLKLVNPSKTAAKALQVAGYDMFLEIYPNQQEAIASFG